MFVVTGSLFGEPRKRLLDSTFVTGTLETTGGHASVPPISATSDYAIPSSKRLRVNTHQHAGSERLMSTNDPLTTLGGVLIPVNNSATHIQCSGSLLSKRPHVHNYEDGGNSSNPVQHEICTNESTSTPVNVRMSMVDFTACINCSVANDPSAHTHCSGSVSSDRAHGPDIPAGAATGTNDYTSHRSRSGGRIVYCVFATVRPKRNKFRFTPIRAQIIIRLPEPKSFLFMVTTDGKYVRGVCARRDLRSSIVLQVHRGHGVFDTSTFLTVMYSTTDVVVQEKDDGGVVVSDGDLK
nr:hypothetical protein [Tanacetum cinerariifolium]